jgi:hypothetical protein
MKEHSGGGKKFQSNNNEVLSTNPRMKISFQMNRDISRMIKVYSERGKNSEKHS